MPRQPCRGIFHPNLMVNLRLSRSFKFHVIPKPSRIEPTNKRQFTASFHFCKITIYFFVEMVYDTPEQSRRPRVKCHRDGELPGGRRKCLRWGHHTRCVIQDLPPLCSNDTRSGYAGLLFAAPCLRVIRILTLPDSFVGIFVFSDRWSKKIAWTSALHTKGGYFYG